MAADVDCKVWEPHMSLVLDKLDEKQRRWVAGLLSEVIGHGGISRVATLSGIDPKTIRKGRQDLENSFKGCPEIGIRHKGAGRPSLQKKTLK